MAQRNVILELSFTEARAANALSAAADAGVGAEAATLPGLETFVYDTSYAPIMLPKVTHVDTPGGELFDTQSALSVTLEPEQSTYLVRGTVEEADLDNLTAAVKRREGIINVYSDPEIQPMIVCPGSAAVGTDADVERLLCTAAMRRSGMNGAGVLVAIVDTGFNIAYLNSKGKRPTFDAARSWSFNPATAPPGAVPVNHGTMCAYDVCIAAPDCTLLDVVLLRPMPAPRPGESVISGLLSDAIRAYRHLLDIMSAPRRPGDTRSMVVNNSWGVFSDSWDFPIGNPGNYSDNPAHPFNVIVASLERAGADILFAAGNCGADCPDGRCGGVTARTIRGANGSASVLCVAGVDTTSARVGYSSIGPGRLTDRKPDISSYTHFRGSGVYAADGGTSAACPVAAGVVAAIRSRRPFNPSDSSTSPAAIRSLITSTATDLGPTGYDYAHGYGVINACELQRRIAPPIIIDSFCERFPDICRNVWLCRRFPQLCERLIPVRPPIRPPFPVPPIPPLPVPPVPPLPGSAAMGDVAAFADMIMADPASAGLTPEEAAYIAGMLDAQAGQLSAPAPHHKENDCGCE
jgi:subtilisin family serine protease